MCQEGLARAISLRLSSVEQQVGLQLDVQIDNFTDISPTCELELYHIIVEALNNVVKHAAASHLTLHLTRTANQIHLLVADNGRGFDPAQTAGGQGLRNIRERVAILNGQISIDSHPNDGTRLEALIPYSTEEP